MTAWCSTMTFLEFLYEAGAPLRPFSFAAGDEGAEELSCALPRSSFGPGKTGHSPDTLSSARGQVRLASGTALKLGCEAGTPTLAPRKRHRR